GEAVLLAQLLGGRRRTGCRPREAVPTPQMSVAVDEALAGIEQLLQAPAIRRARDPAGPRQPPAESRRRVDLAGQRLGALRQRGAGERRELDPPGGIRRQLPWGRQQRRRQLAIE